MSALPSVCWKNDRFGLEIGFRTVSRFESERDGVVHCACCGKKKQRWGPIAHLAAQSTPRPSMPAAARFPRGADLSGGEPVLDEFGASSEVDDGLEHLRIQSAADA
jgi:hypothetical protein